MIKNVTIFMTLKTNFELMRKAKKLQVIVGMMITHDCENDRHHRHSILEDLFLVLQYNAFLTRRDNRKPSPEYQAILFPREVSKKNAFTQKLHAM